MSRLQEKRTWLVGGAGVAVLIAAASWFGLIAPQRSSTSSLRDQSAAAQTQNGVLAVKVAKLKAENEKAPQLRASLKEALAALPFDSGLPTFTRQLSAQAGHNHITLTSIAVGGIAPVTVAVPAPTSAASGPTPTGTAATAAPAATAAASAVPVAIPVTLTSSGSAKNQLAFLRAIQVTGPRRALVISTALASAAQGKSKTTSIDKFSTMTTQLSVFSTPLTAAQRTQLEKLLSSK